LIFPFLERTRHRRQWFKLMIVAMTALVLAGMIGASRTGRNRLWLGMSHLRDGLYRCLFHLEPERAQVEAELRQQRQQRIEQARASLAAFYQGAPQETQELFRVAGMDPEHALVTCGRSDQAFVISPQVFEPDEHGRSYRFRPLTRSVWLRQITIRGGPFMMFQVLDTKQHRAAAQGAGAIVDTGSIQETNSWGLRGPEPDPAAPLRGIVLGDSYMQGMFNADSDTPPLCLERELETAGKIGVSILNTGHVGYAPEQYYHTLSEFGDRFRPQFVVVSVCPNDFGDEWAVMQGEGDDYEEAGYWLGLIDQWCRSRQTVSLCVPAPVHLQVEAGRHDGQYPGRVSSILRAHSSSYCFPLDEFIDEHLRLASLAEKEGKPPLPCRLYNGNRGDNHFSPLGARLWARIVSRRLLLLLKRRGMLPIGGTSPRINSVSQPKVPGSLR
jgi:hypothetical protein